MRLEDQVCSLEPSKRLRELGVRQESNFYWSQIYSERFNLKREYELCFFDDIEFTRYRKDGGKVYSAFTVGELGEMLPQEVNGFEILIQRELDIHYPNEWRVSYIEWDYEGYDTRFGPFYDKSEAVARANMLIHLIEQGIVNPELLNS